MKTVKTYLTCLGVVAMMYGKAQTTNTELLPDQNPNYKTSMDKYMAKKDELTANEGTTVQDTYKAIDEMQIKQERKDLAKQRRHERKMARIQGRNSNRNYVRPYYGPNYNYGWGNNGYGTSIYNGINTGANLALLGLGLYWLLK